MSNGCASSACTHSPRSRNHEFAQPAEPESSRSRRQRRIDRAEPGLERRCDTPLPTAVAPREDSAVDGVHDMGGMHGFGRVPGEADGVFHARWEQRVWAMLGAVMGFTTIDRFRYTIERMPPAEYLASSYYERWLW